MKRLRTRRSLLSHEDNISNGDTNGVKRESSEESNGSAKRDRKVRRETLTKQLASELKQDEEIKAIGTRGRSTRGTRSSSRLASKGGTPSAKSGPKSERSIKQEEEEMPDGSSDLDSDSELRKVKRIKLKLPSVVRTVTHPDHVTKPQFGSLDKFLDSYKTFMDEDLTNEEYESKLKDQLDMVDKINAAIDNKILKVDLNSKKIVKYPKPKSFVDPFTTIPTHHDHFVAQAVKMSKIFSDSRRAKISRCKKISLMVENHFKRAEGESEREAKEHERQMKKLARNTVTMVKKRWREVEKAHTIIVNKRKEMEKLEESKKTMNRMVMDSSLRAVGHAIQGAKTDESDTDGSSDSGSNIDDSAAESDLDVIDEKDEEKNENNNTINEMDDDSKLTQEELKKKYAFLENYEMEKGDSDDENKQDNKLEKENSEVAESEDAEPADVLTEEDIERYKKIEQSEDPLLNEDSDDYDSDSEDSEESDSEDEESEEEAGTGLAALFGDLENDTVDQKDGIESQVEDKQDEDFNIEKDEEKPADTAEEKPGEEEEEAEREAKVKTETKTESQNRFSLDRTPDTAAIPSVPVPSLLRGTLREYQKQGLNWLANLYNNNTNGILADEMGLGKTIQTISLLAYLACEKHIWGPHLIVVPTSVMLNWEMEFKRFAPGFKVLTYYGNPQQRKEKRRGWNKPDAFHVCITSYQLVCHDHQSFRRRKWEYMILDEAHNIKNFRTTRWQSLLNFNTKRRLLLTGTPLQNNLAELWSLLYFLMPSSKNVSSMPEGFASLEEFQQWFGRPVDKLVEGTNDFETRETIQKLHKVLRPYLLRRLKADVETQMPGKYEHILYCKLSKRQRFLYDDFMSRAQTKETLASGNFLSIINCLMQLRKVCNHPDLFEVRPILTSLAVPKSVVSDYKVPKYLQNLTRNSVDLKSLNMVFTNNEDLSNICANSIAKLNAHPQLAEQCESIKELVSEVKVPNFSDLHQFYEYYEYVARQDAMSHAEHVIYVNDLRCNRKPVFGRNLLDILHLEPKQSELHAMEELIKPLQSRLIENSAKIDQFAFVTPAVVALDVKNIIVPEPVQNQISLIKPDFFAENPLHKPQMQLSIQFPHKSLLLYDSGKLQKLAKLLADLKEKGHRALIFTQMTKVLDILEKFLNALGYLYMRLDGATKVEDRQLLTEKFNRDPRITCFILSTRSGGLGINLTGADTVIFYDNDWNPAMDKQCQDRCHRIGQTRDVHIYRFVSEFTIEENIMRKSNYKRKLDNVVIQEGDFTTDYFGKLTLSDLLGDKVGNEGNKLLMAGGNIESLAQAEDAEDAAAAKEAAKESQVDVEDFDENSVQPEGSAREASVASLNASNNDEQAMEIDEAEEDDGIGHIDEYMLRFIEEGYYY